MKHVSLIAALLLAGASSLALAKPATATGHSRPAAHAKAGKAAHPAAVANKKLAAKKTGAKKAAGKKQLAKKKGSAGKARA